MFLGSPVWYAMCLSCGYREVRKVWNISPPAACPDCQSRNPRAFPVHFGRRGRDGRIFAEKTQHVTEPIPLGISRVV